MSEQWVREIIKLANGAGADLIVGLGDYVHKRRTADELMAVWPMIKALKAPGGVYFINGNHEHWADRSLSLSLLEQSGSSLRHRHVLVHRRGATIALAGCGDMRGGDEPGLEKALAGIPDDMFSIVAAHNPDTADLPHGKRVDLFLCGHTHGGQIVVPFIEKPIMLPVKNKTYSRGLKQNARHEAVFISRGIGWAIVPVRLNCPPELAMIQLMKRKPPARQAPRHGRHYGRVTM
jgi:predicted MPP superfamily phosphohydrolase